MARHIESNLNARAHEYFGGDVQRYWIERDKRAGAAVYRLYQMTHRGGAREAACVIAFKADKARQMFNAIAESDAAEHC